MRELETQARFPKTGEGVPLVVSCALTRRPPPFTADRMVTVEFDPFELLKELQDVVCRWRGAEGISLLISNTQNRALPKK